MPSVLMLSSDLSTYQRNEEFTQQVREEANKKFNSTVYVGDIPGTSYKINPVFSIHMYHKCSIKHPFLNNRPPFH